MRFIRYIYNRQPPRTGWVLGQGDELRVGPVDGDLYGEFRRLEADIPLAEVRLLAPVLPSKIICVGRNYVAHAREHQAEVPDIPLLFLKPPTALIGPGDAVVLPPQSQQIEHEAELVVVIGRRVRWIDTEDSLKHVLGYTIGNDVTARDLQRRDGQWTRAKGFDTFCPIGPWIDTDFDPTDAMISCHVNDDMRQMASTRDMVFSVRQLVAFASSVMTLEPGDLLMTGTPAGVSPMQAGDTVRITIDGLGSLSNPVMDEAAR